MEFHIARDPRMPDTGVIEEAVLDHDPAAVVDVDGGTVRLSTWMESPQLLEVLDVAGWKLQPGRIEQQPSVCCGGCGG